MKPRFYQLLGAICLIGMVGSPALGAAVARPVDCSHSVPAGFAHCDASILVSPQDVPLISSRPSGYGPAQFHAAYGVPATTSSPASLAVVVAYHDPGLARDLQTYDAAFSLPNPPRLQQVSQRGGADFPTSNAGWALEESMDVETTHEICQNCNLIVVEADSASTADLMTAIDTAVARGARVVSNSWGGSETRNDLRTNSHFQRAGVTFVASSGDDGYGVEYPAASPAVVAAGGTTLHLTAGGARSSEIAWVGGGSGCSQYEPKPPWQHDSGCTKRTVTDVAADADPATGAAIYDSLSYQGHKGWVTLGGTSLAAPLIAGMYGLAGSGSGASTLYQARVGLHDVVSGSNGSCRTYLCKSLAGYDGPSGNGSPSGLSALR